MNVLIFDIETIPDVESGRKLYPSLSSLQDRDVAEALFQKRRQEKGSDFLPLPLHKIVAISVVLSTSEQLKVGSLGKEDSKEAELVQRFFDGIEQFSPTLVSWNGSGFDLPVLHYRSLLHGIASPKYWETGESDASFRWNNYLNRFHYRHTDLMDVLSAYQPKAATSLNELSLVLGLPGKMGMGGDKVWESYQAGQLSAIRNYCETDVLNTYLIYLRFQLMRGVLTQQNYKAECERVETTLSTSEKAHLQQFLSVWQTGKA
ncbi:MAG: 3'-5' exonuclease [Gammaproteobacteria bacterium]|nr:3'-5' exonuclease [Gammaproteobacteria bacterium]